MSDEEDFAEFAQDEGPAEDITESQLFCWREPNRMCGPDCVAFDDRSVRDSRFSPCMIINSARQQAVALSGIGSQLKRGNDFAEKESEIILQENIEAKRQRLEAGKRQEAAERAQKLRDLDRPPPEVKT